MAHPDRLTSPRHRVLVRAACRRPGLRVAVARRGRGGSVPRRGEAKAQPDRAGASVEPGQGRGVEQGSGGAGRGTGETEQRADRCRQERAGERSEALGDGSETCRVHRAGQRHPKLDHRTQGSHRQDAERHAEDRPHTAAGAGHQARRCACRRAQRHAARQYFPRIEISGRQPLARAGRLGHGRERHSRPARQGEERGRAVGGGAGEPRPVARGEEARRGARRGRARRHSSSPRPSRRRPSRI